MLVVMSDVTKVLCYIEEYRNAQGQRAGRLREKGSGRKVDLGLAPEAETQKFLFFLSAAAANRSVMPDVFSRDGGDDAIAVSGDVDFDAPDELRFIFNERLSYLFV
ncbi:hypothetical protein NS220_14270 [Microbacterium testaceum]|uniref:Uncharacterized protein n=1 Tax=Microbacterium testaceum TaxID=2033 RepID=A0A147EU46_MICTE|nr:hypothetical protein [Microbacterium testaceum]KTR92600.1 hypothetical protein NS220_14270 [Microbacterium testaceum]